MLPGSGRRSRAVGASPVCLVASAFLLLPSVVPAQAGSDRGLTVRGSVLSNAADFDVAVHLLPEPTRYEQMTAVAGERSEGELTGGSAFGFRKGERAFEVRAPVSDASWVVVQPSRRGFTTAAVAFPLMGPLSHVLLPPIVPERGASCRLRLVKPARAWVARDMPAWDADGSSGPRWTTWRPWLRLDRNRDRERWLNPVGQWRTTPRALQVTVGAPGYLPSDFRCSPGGLIEVRLEPREGPLVELELIRDGGDDDQGPTGWPLAAAVLVHADGWPAGLADEEGRISVPRGSFHVLGPSGGEWPIQVESSGTWRLRAPERRAAALLPDGVDRQASTGDATRAVAVHRSQTGALLARDETPLTEAGPPGEERLAWVVRPPPGAVETTLLVPGFDQATFDWSLPSEEFDEEEIELTAFRSIEGVVLDDRSGEPLQGAEAALHDDYPGGLGRLGMTAPNGVFRIESSASSTSGSLTGGFAALRLVVHAAGYRRASLVGDSLASAVGSGLVVVRLEQASALAGRIVSPAGKGLAGSAALVGRQGVFAPPSVGSVDRFLPLNPGIHAVTEADEGGQFHFAEVLPGVRSVAVGAPGHATRLVPLRSSSGDGSGHDGAPGEWVGRFDLGDVVLVPELAVEGVVRDVGGVPLAGAAVRFGRSSRVVGVFGLEGTALPTGEVGTDSDGGFRIGGLGEGDLIDLVVEHPGHAAVELPRVAVDRAADPVWLEIEMNRAVELVGIVVDEATREGIEGARLQLLDGTERRQLAIGRTGSNGRFALRGLASLNGVLQVEAFGHVPLRQVLSDDPDHGGLQSNADDGLVLALRRGRSVVRGVVLSSGAPVAGAVVQMNTKDTATTDGAGRFELSGLPAGESMVFCWPSGQRSGQPIIWYREVEPGVNELVFDLTAVEITGRVEDSSGFAVSRVRVVAVRPYAPAVETQGGNDGSFSLVVTPGRYRVHAEAHGYADAVREIDVGSAAPPRVVLRLGEARELRVRVSGLGPEEAESVEVLMESTPLSPGGGVGLSRSSDETAAPLFMRANPPEGTVVIVARTRPSGRARRRTVDVLPRGVTEVEILFDDGETSGRLAGVVTVDGSPLAGAPVFVIDESAGDAWAVRTDHRGAYVLDGLRRGRVDIAAVGERRTVNVEAGIRADFRSRSAVLAGRVVRADSGGPAAGFEVVAVPAHATLEIAERLGQTRAARSAENGAFLIDGLFQVPYRVIARRRGGRIVGSSMVDLAVPGDGILIAVPDAAPE